MTRYAAPAVIACPYCDEPMLQQRLASIHSYGATYWSDGYASIIGFSRGLDIGACPSCEGIFWVEDAMRLGTMHREPESCRWPFWKRTLGRFEKKHAAILAKESDWRAIPDDWYWAGQLQKPRGRELLWALERGIASTPEREMQLRQKLWWAGNHPDRGYSMENPMTPEQTRDNQEALLEKIRHQPAETKKALTEAELLRQLRCFDEALAELDQSSLANDTTAALIATCARNGDAKVCKVGGWSSID